MIKIKQSLAISTGKGQSMFEVVIALFIISLIVVGVIVLSTNSVSNSTFSRNGTQAGRYAQEAIEWLRDEEAINTTLFKSRAPLVDITNTFCMVGLTVADWSNIGVCGSTEYVSGSSLFMREVRLTRRIISGKTIIEAEAKVYWDDAKGRHEVKSVTNFSDIRERGTTVVPAPTSVPTSGPTSAPTATPSGCTNLTFIPGSSSVTPTMVTNGGAYTIRCTYSAQSTGIMWSSNAGNCTFSSWSGNTAIFNCTATQPDGNYANRCRIIIPNSQNHCAQTNNINNITIQ